MTDTYVLYGLEFRFNDQVEVYGVLLPLEERIGRLIQVRKNCGAYGSDIFFVRLPDGMLVTFENAAIKKYLERPLPIEESDTVQVAYTIKQKFPEIGFIIENPNQPKSSSPSFSLMITSASPE